MMNIRTKSTTKSAPQNGIKVRKIGATWWGQRWIESLEHMSRDYLNHLGRGRSYARAGRVHDLKIDSGTVTAFVTGQEGEPYEVILRVAMLPPASWAKVIEAMSQQALFTAELLGGQMPREIEQAFRAAGHSLFPAKQREIETDCSCADWANPCKHVAAVHYVLGEAFDKDPFLLFELRGRTKKQVLNALSALRSGVADEPTIVGRRAERARNTSMVIDVTQYRSEDYERAPAPLPRLQLSLRQPTNGGMLNQIGAPPSWPHEELSYAEMQEAYRAAARLARELALGSAISVNSPSETESTVADTKPVETT